LQPISTQLKTYDAKLVALPEERTDEIRKMLSEAKIQEHATKRNRRHV
jgi:hypothetical protein